MAVRDIVPVPGASFEETLASAHPDLLREMIRGFAQRMMDAEVETICGAGYGEVSPGAGELAERVPAAGVGHPGRDDRAGDPEAAARLYFPGFLEHRRRAERALVTVVATSYLLGVSTRRVEKLAESLGRDEAVASRRSASWRPSSTRWSRGSGTGGWTPGRTPSCGWTR